MPGETSSTDSDPTAKYTDMAAELLSQTESLDTQQAEREARLAPVKTLLDGTKLVYGSGKQSFNEIDILLAQVPLEGHEAGADILVDLTGSGEASSGKFTEAIGKLSLRMKSHNTETSRVAFAFNMSGEDAQVFEADPRTGEPIVKDLATRALEPGEPSFKDFANIAQRVAEYRQAKHDEKRRLAQQRGSTS